MGLGHWWDWEGSFNLTQPMGAIVPLELLGLYIFSRGKIEVRLLLDGSPQKEPAFFRSGLMKTHWFPEQ